VGRGLDYGRNRLPCSTQLSIVVPMKSTTYTGIDYGAGRSNIDNTTGIRFGVIAQGSIDPEAFDDVWMNARDLSHESAIAQVKTELDRIETVEELAEWLNENLHCRMDAPKWAALILDGYATDDGEIVQPNRAEVTSVMWDQIEQTWNDQYEDYGERDWLYESDGYKLINCLTSDVMVLASPYFTYAQFCSPCVPGACNLGNPLDVTASDGLPMPSSLVEHDRCYCLGHNYFEGNKAPYPVYSVATGELVPSE
jgi:hypothetical protein